ncbi:PA2778 family cysteine peptidase [Aliiglaciecola sp. CAU 1673]|uniref:PA2778 family cysteine peptidase n=1 Tax=Aliiglaciecola sp. CAU 1673 TaxID=3032595 RepID=UPI0023DC20AE|nr:PA2778 family cysteine peptidase [Aliiglaciecola sp. CAU 1673]MDF2177431.1 PA2778 family cysteine peptidase [Aliiglaciecola sp. CAU 1673]
MKSLLFLKACLLAGFFMLSGCQTPPQTRALLHSPPGDIASQIRIDSVPFIPQQDFYCGPTTLAEVFGYHHKPVSPEQIAPKLFIPEKEGSLQLEMVVATRQFGLLPYSKQSDLRELLSLIDAGIPTIVFQNLSIPWLPQWHYAVVIGYDLNEQTITLHTGLTPNHSMSFALFEKTWARGGYWLLAPLPQTVTSPVLDPFIYVSAAYDMLAIGKTNEALGFLENATKQWPGQWLPYFLIANHYLSEQPEMAVEWFGKGYNAGKGQLAYLNNYAVALQKINCAEHAKNIIELALTTFPGDETLIETQQDIERHGAASGPMCEMKMVAPPALTPGT